MSHADGNSTEGESASGRNPAQTGTGCYRNFDHFPNRPRRSNSSTTPCLPGGDGPPPQPGSPGSQRRLLDLGPSEEQSEPYQENAPLTAPLAQDETQLIPSTPKGYISPSADSKKSDPMRRVEKADEIPSEFECCFCTSKDFKEFVDAENLMPLATSEFRNPVCMEMRNMRAQEQLFNNLNNYSNFLEYDDMPPKKTNNGDLASMDSSDTFASCTTHPFNSQGDLTSDIADPSCGMDSNLYVNPLDKSGENSPVTPAAPVAPNGARASGVKKSASGDTALRSLTTSPMEEGFRGFGPLERGSRVSLNDSPLPKHRKTRFQQESLERKKKSFMPSRGLASATRIINQHLFGLQNMAGSRGKNSGSKSSLSIESIDSRTSPQLELHRRSKSILKKSDSSGNRSNDPESERLISDNGSGYECGSGNEYSPNKRLSSPPMRHRSMSQKSSSKNLPAYQQELERTRTLKSQLFLLDDYIGKAEGKSREGGGGVGVLDSNRMKQCGDSVSELPLYICPPPPPMDDHSPTEETKLLLHSTMAVPSPKQPTNSISKGHIPSS